MNRLPTRAELQAVRVVETEEKKRTEKKLPLTVEQKAEVLRLVETLKSQVAAADEWNKHHPQQTVTQSAISKWLKYGIAEPKSPGAKELISNPADVAAVLRAFDGFRTRCVSVDSSLFAAAARGIMRQIRPSMFLHGVDARGVCRFSNNWARSFMKKHGLKALKATTNRTVPPKEIVEGGAAFYKSLGQVAPCPGLTVNADEFFCLLAGNNRTWTWTRQHARGENISVKEERLGFTCTAVTAADGTFVTLQMIWKGKTANSEARMNADELDGVIMQCHQEESCFQTAGTWKELLARLKRWFADRLAAPQYAGKRGCFIYDHATQHGSLEECKSFFTGMPIDVVLVPKGQTHVFQPADMFVIACLKKKAQAAWNSWVEEVFASATTPEPAVIAAVCETSLTVKKQTKYRLLSEAIRSLASTDSVVASWEASGCLRAMGVPPRLNDQGQPFQHVLYDSYVHVCGLAADDVPALQADEELRDAVSQTESAANGGPPKRGRGRPPKPPTQQIVKEGPLKLMFAKIREKRQREEEVQATTPPAEPQRDAAETTATRNPIEETDDSDSDASDWD